MDVKIVPLESKDLNLFINKSKRLINLFKRWMDLNNVFEK